MKFIMEVQLDNAAFADTDGPPHLARMLHGVALDVARLDELADDAVDEGGGMPLMDVNCNRVGRWAIEV